MSERIDIEKPEDAIAWLRAHRLIGAAETPDVEVLAGGVSSRTVLAGPMVLKQSLPKLRVAVDWFSDPVRIHREALAMHWLAHLAPPDTITRLLVDDPEEHVIAMEAVPKPHANWKTMLLAGDVRREHVRQFGALLGAVHRSSAQRADELRPLFHDQTFFETLRVEPYYRYTAKLAPDFIHTLIDEALATSASLVHGDFSPKNILVHQDRLVLLDHEVAHFGDPAFDIGFAMAHLLSKAHHLPPLRTAFLNAALEFWASYGLWQPYQGFEARCVRHSLACLLARVRGRSPLEYLSPEEKDRQAASVLMFMHHVPHDVPSLVAEFGEEIACP